MLPSPLAPPGFSQTIAANLQASSSLTEALQEWLEAQGASLKEAMQIGLMVDELLTNTITHGYPAEGAATQSEISSISNNNKNNAGSITVSADIAMLANLAQPSSADKTVVLTLQDNALAFDPLSLPGPDLTLDMEHRPIGGLGVYFVRQLADEIAYSRCEVPNSISSTDNSLVQGNRLRFSKRLQKPTAS